jgi:hypothetical protein
MKTLIPVDINAKLISNGKSYEGMIGNLSENGAFVETDITGAVTHFMPRKKLELKFHVSSKKTITVNGEVVWLHAEKNASNGLTSSISLEITDSSHAYKKFLKTL